MMDRNQEIRQWVYGTECILRPINAMTFLEARLEGGRIAERFNGDAAAAKLGERAYILSKGLYDGDKPMFTSGEEVLETLQAEEILEIAEAYTETASKWEDQQWSAPNVTNQKQQKPENTPVTDEMYINRAATGVEEDLVFPEKKIQQYTEEQPSDVYMALTKTGTGPDHRFSPENFQMYGNTRRDLYTEKADVRTISEYMERDGRRYDGGYIRY